jgi:formylglycine-generating enzyme required for sulfatase activity
MKRTLVVSITIFALLSSLASADSFGTGGNQFTIDFVNISGDASSANGTFIGDNKPEGFADPGNYRIGTYEITNAQWTKFKSAYGDVKGTPTSAYDREPYYPDTSVPTNCTSWYEAAQFVNWLNTSSGKSAAYKFTGTLGGTGDYTLGVWQAGDAGFNAANPYRNSNAFYFLPTENEWVKAAYWNGSALQTYATKAGECLYQGNGTNGGWNFYNERYATNPYGPWAVGSGSQELNGTFDMMGNVMEWMENPYYTGEYTSGANRGFRGGSYYYYLYSFASSSRHSDNPANDSTSLGFRVASIVPEPASLTLLFLGGLALRYRKR